MAGYGIIGFGGIGRRIAAVLDRSPGGPPLRAVLVRPRQAVEARALLGRDVVCTELDAFLAARPEVTVEAASGATLAAVASPVLAAGIDLMPLSLAVLADRDVERAIVAAASAGPGRLEVPAGAVGSLGFLAAAREDELADVLVRAAFPVARLIGTKADRMADLPAITGRQVIFRGSVRELADGFNRRINVTVAVALAGLGLDRTRAELVADAALPQATFTVEARAGPGDVRLEIGHRDVPAGADPADYTALSVVRLLRRRTARVAI